jgi:hypothetical protein
VNTGPPGWGEDEITRFLATAHSNTLTTFAHQPEFYAHVGAIDAIYRELAGLFRSGEDWLPGVFFLRVHAGLLGGIRLAVSGQVSETYPLLRSALESALYALYIHDSPPRARTWLDRGDSPEARAAMKREFRMVNVFACLERKSATVHSRVNTLYERAIDYGAHPNPQAFLTNMSIEQGPDATRLQLNYLAGNSDAIQFVLKTVLQVGLASLDVFALIVPERFSILGIDQRIKNLGRGL